MKSITDFFSGFPLVHSSPFVKLDIIANYSRLYTITGSNTSLTPYLLAAHLDVVPAIPEEWEFPPFEAQIKDEYIYARGAIDFKQGIMVRMINNRFQRLLQ